MRYKSVHFMKVIDVNVFMDNLLQDEVLLKESANQYEMYVPSCQRVIDSLIGQPINEFMGLIDSMDTHLIHHVDCPFPL